MTDLAPFKGLIKEKCGLSFDDLRGGNLASGLKKRMSVRGVGSREEYLSCLMSDQDEFHCLVNLLTINETYFFREPAHLRVMTSRVLPGLLAERRGTEKIKILSAGCSTGEEPYSIVMSVMEKYGLGIRDFISVIGADIDGDALEKAKKGVYGPHAFRSGEDNLKAKYFEACGTGEYRIKDVVRERVSFRKVNLLGDYHPEYEGLDIIFYRNVSIYFEPETQMRIFSRLAGLLREKGVLFVSSTETLSHNSGILSLVELDGQYLFRKDFPPADGLLNGPAAPVKRPALPPSGPDRPAAVLRRAVEAGAKSILRAPPRKVGPVAVSAAPAEKPALFLKDAGSSFEEAVSLARGKKYEEALGVIEGLLERDRAHVGAHMLKAGILLNLKRLEEAERVCLEGLGHDKWHAEAYMILGLIARSKGDDEGARKRFREVLYISPSIWPAHFYLAEIYRAGGDAGKACREYEIVAKLLAKGSAEEHGFTFFHLSVPPHQIERLCKRNISLLRKERR